MASQWLLPSSLQRFSGNHCQHTGADLKSCWLLQGQYNDQAWDALDFIISEAGNRGLRLVIAIADNWETDSNTDNKCAQAPCGSCMTCLDSTCCMGTPVHGITEADAAAHAGLSMSTPAPRQEVPRTLSTPMPQLRATTRRTSRRWSTMSTASLARQVPSLTSLLSQRGLAHHQRDAEGCDSGLGDVVRSLGATRS